MPRILVADPDPRSREALALLLVRRMEQTAVCEARDSETLIRLLDDCPPDILLLDWHLYGAPAPETCRLLLRAFPALKIILLSLDAEDAAVARQAGASFIHKGATPTDLLKILESQLNKDPSH